MRLRPRPWSVHGRIGKHYTGVAHSFRCGEGFIIVTASCQPDRVTLLVLGKWADFPNNLPGIKTFTRREAWV